MSQVKIPRHNRRLPDGRVVPVKASGYYKKNVAVLPMPMERRTSLCGGWATEDEGPVPVFKLAKFDFETNTTKFELSKGLLSKRVINKRIRQATGIIQAVYGGSVPKVQAFYDDETYREVVQNERMKAYWGSRDLSKQLERPFPMACVRQGKVWLSPELVRDISDGDVNSLRIVAHEATHLLDFHQGLISGPNAVFVEGATEILSMAAWVRNSPNSVTPGDKLSKVDETGTRMLVTDPFEIMIWRSNYQDKVGEVIMNAAVRCGFDKEKVLEWIEDTYMNGLEDDPERNGMFDLGDKRFSSKVVRFGDRDQFKNSPKIWEKVENNRAVFDDLAEVYGVDMNSFQAFSDSDDTDDVLFHEDLCRTGSLLTWLFR